jgi:hypothetical protein
VVSLVLAGGCRLGFDDLGNGDDGDDVAGAPRLTVTMVGSGGMVVGPNGFSCTTGTCSVELDAGTPVTLRGLAQTGRWFAGWSGPCGGNFDCAITVDADVIVEAEFTDRPNRAFVTSAAFDGAIGGASAADQRCSESATSAGLDGTWVAYVSDGIDRNAVDLLAGSRGWIRTDGAPIADSPTQFVNGPLAFVPRLDEFGDDLQDVLVYTGSMNGVMVDASHCLGWTSNDPANAGAVIGTEWGSTFATWAFPQPCDALHHLLCVETGKTVPVVVRPDHGRIAFVTSGEWTPGGGRGAADALCASEAAQSTLPGTYLAALATSTETIADRFAPGLPWRRIDGVRLTRTSTLFVEDFLDVAPERDRAGQVVANDFWTGAMSFDTLAESNGNCNDWTVGDTSALGDMHFTTNTWVGSPAKREPCDWAVPLLCLQE